MFRYEYLLGKISKSLLLILAFFYFINFSSIEASGRVTIDTIADLPTLSGFIVDDDPAQEGVVFLSTSSGEESLLIRITKVLLRITVAVGVTMVLIAGVKLLFGQGQSGSVAKLGKQIGFIIGGIILALLSFALIELIESGVLTLTNLSQGVPD